MQKVLQRRMRQSREKLKQARKKLKREVEIAKNKSIDSHCNNINDFGTKKAWDSIKITERFPTENLSICPETNEETRWLYMSDT